MPPASGGHSASLHPTRARRPPDLLHVPAQTLYNQTSEALDQMLQSFIVQNPTADELHFLLSVRAAVAGQLGVAQAGQRVDRGGCPRGGRA